MWINCKEANKQAFIVGLFCVSRGPSAAIADISGNYYSVSRVSMQLAYIEQNASYAEKKFSKVPHRIEQAVITSSVAPLRCLAMSKRTVLAVAVPFSYSAML